MSKKESRKNNGHKKTKGYFEGKLEITRSGMGFVLTGKDEKDIIVRPHDFNHALNGDTVKVRIKDAHAKRKEGVVEEILERKTEYFVGTLEVSENFAFFNPQSEVSIPDFYISLKKTGRAKNGDNVVVRFLHWNKDEKKPEGEVVEVLDATNAADMAMKEIIVQNGFPLSFPEEVIREANAVTDEITPDELSRRRDYRSELTFTIDPFDAKDFDDALSIKKTGRWTFEIGVHIADVSHFVRPGSKMDAEGYARATSVYMPDRVIPMLPERISNELCSLRPNEDKFAFSVIFQINHKGQVKDCWLGKTFIRSDHRYTYEEVQEIIDGRDDEFREQIISLHQIAQNLRKDRFAHGAINFSTTEVKFKLAEDGDPIEVIVKESLPAHQLIEEFMLLANRSVATHVAKIKINEKQVPFPYRIHDTPDEEKLLPFVAFAKKFGYTFDTSDWNTVAKSFNKLMADVHGKPEQHVLEQLGIRTMAKARYTTENIGHYGLGFKDYCHFTSPIRRYPDVMAHRTLQKLLLGEQKFDDSMEEKCVHCSERERAAMEAERAGNKYKQVQFMLDKVGEDFDAVISGVASFGFWAETVNEKCEGLVSTKDLFEYDDFRVDDVNYSLVGQHTGKTFRMGQKVRVKLMAANLDKRQLDFDWVPQEKDFLRSEKQDSRAEKKEREEKRDGAKRNGQSGKKEGSTKQERMGGKDRRGNQKQEGERREMKKHDANRNPSAKKHQSENKATAKKNKK